MQCLPAAAHASRRPARSMLHPGSPPAHGNLRTNSPCNQFGAQEPGEPEDIKAFVYGEAQRNKDDLQLAGGLKAATNFTLLAKSAINGNVRTQSIQITT